MKTVITIEPVAPGHADVLERLISDPLVAETTANIPHPYPEGGAIEWIRKRQQEWSEGAAYGFAVLAGGEFVGSISIMDVDEGQGEIGYWIGRPYWGRGYATEACRQVVDFAFSELQLKRLTAKCLVRNKGSFRVLEKAGFRLTGYGVVAKPRWPEPEKTAEFELTRESGLSVK